MHVHKATNCQQEIVVLFISDPRLVGVGEYKIVQCAVAVRVYCFVLNLIFAYTVRVENKDHKTNNREW